MHSTAVRAKNLIDTMRVLVKEQISRNELFDYYFTISRHYKIRRC